MQGELLDWLLRYLQLGRLCIKHAVLTFKVMWYESEARYFDKRIAKLERELVKLEES